MATVAERFWEKVDTSSNCWVWIAARTGDGYGNFWEGGKNVYAHRWAYEYLRGPIPETLTLDHLCRNRACVNPDHLEPVTLQENVLRSPVAPAAVNARKTHCLRGHEFTGPNTYIRLDGRGRECRACWGIRNQ